MTNYIAKFSIYCALIGAACAVTLAQDLFEVQTWGVPYPGYLYTTANFGTSSWGPTDNLGRLAVEYSGNKPLVYFPIAPKEVAAYNIVNTRFDVRNEQNAVIRSFAGSSGATDFHDFTKLRNGNYLVLTYEGRRIDLSVERPGGNKNATVVGNVLEEYTPGGTLVWQWKSLDYIPVGHATYNIDFAMNSVDYLHINSTMEDADGNIIISARHTDAVYKVNKQTKAIMWTLGGCASVVNDFVFQNDSLSSSCVGFSHQHTAFRRANGNLVLFDNGNLHPLPKSRYVEYTLSESSKQVRKVREYYHPQGVYAPSMGSVQELPNGNMLIGWGNNDEGYVATEITPLGEVVLEAFDKSPEPNGTYRVLKSGMHLADSYKVTSGPGTVVMDEADSATGVSFTFSRANNNTELSAERHFAATINRTYTTGTVEPCLVLPYRWVIRSSNATTLEGSTTLDVSTLSAILAPELLTMYVRDVEGEGDFRKVTTTFNKATGRFTASGVILGEVILGYVPCSKPSITTPKDVSTQISLSTTVTWTESVQRDGYQLQISTSSTFQDNLRTLGATTTQLVVQDLQPATRYFLRVRGVTGTVTTEWSPVVSFFTALPVPSLVEPVGVNDTARVAQRVRFVWSSKKTSASYNLIVKNLVEGEDEVNIVTNNLEYTATLPYGYLYSWEVRCVLDSIKGQSSGATLVYVYPNAPTLQRPSNYEVDVPYVGASVEWNPLVAINAYQVEVYLDDQITPWFFSEVSGTGTALPTLPPNRSFTWRVRGITRFGPGVWSDLWTATTSDRVSLPTPEILSPVQGQITDTTNVELRWSNVAAATGYDVQVAIGNFTNPLVSEVEYADTSLVIAKIPSGTVLRWRVRATANDRASLWSAAPQFSSRPSAISALAPVQPEHGSINVPLSGNFVFVTNARFSTYAIRYDTTEIFANPKELAAPTGSPLRYEGLLPNSTYYWRVFGMDNAGNKDSGSVARFSTINTTSSVDAEDSPVARVAATSSHLTFYGSFEAQATEMYAVAMNGSTIPLELIAQNSAEIVASLHNVPQGMYLVVVRGISGMPTTLVSIVR
jgi:hypothetical protein